MVEGNKPPKDTLAAIQAFTVSHFGGRVLGDQGKLPKDNTQAEVVKEDSFHTLRK